MSSHFSATKLGPRSKNEGPVANSGNSLAPNNSAPRKQGLSDNTRARGSTLSASTRSSVQPNKYFYDLPGHLDYLQSREAVRAGWSSTVDNVMDEILRNRRDKGLSIKSYNPARETGSNTSTDIIKWLAYPSSSGYDTKKKCKNKYEKADLRAYQDEYCEWEVTRENGHLKTVTFTTEVQEYYTYLAQADPTGTLILDQYRRLNPDVANLIKLDHLLDAEGAYDIKNCWNTRDFNTGPDSQGRIAHLIRENNSLKEAAALVVDSTVERVDYERNAITDGSALLRAMDPPVSATSPLRNSDPDITNFINEKSRDGQLVTVSNPVGLYIHSFEDSEFKTESGNSVSGFWKVERVSRDGHYAVRAKFTVPGDLLGKIVNARSRRTLEYGSQLAESIWIAVHVEIAEAISIPQNPGPGSASCSIYSFIEGRQIKPTIVAQDIVDKELRCEAFGAYLASTKKPAITLKDLIATFEDYTWTAYAADEGIGFHNEDVRVRIVLIWIPGLVARPTKSRNTSRKMGDVKTLKDNAFKRQTVMVVMVPPFNDKTNTHSEKSILQIASFDPGLGSFNFYDRERTGGSHWLYFGNSNDAFAPDTHGLGPFCGHPNGALAMKEMLEPWSHWHTSKVHLKLKQGHPLLQDPLFRDIDHRSWYFDSADQLAHMISEGNKKWFEKRRLLDFGPSEAPSPTATRIHQWISHACMNTTVEIRSSATAIPSNPKPDGTFKVPPGFFFNHEALGWVIDEVGDLADEINPISWVRYKEASLKLELSSVSEFSTQTSDKDVIATKNEGFVPWKIVTPSSEDIEGISVLIETGLLPKTTVAAILMVDFWNPVFSTRRAQLMRYVPSTATYDATASKEDKYALGEDLVAAVEQGIENYGRDKASPEAEFISLARNPKIIKDAKAQIQMYVANINRHLDTADGVLDYLRVAETRRRTFRPHPRSQKPAHALAEFSLTLPYARNMDEDTWVMKADGSVEKAALRRDVWHPRDNQAHLIASGCPYSQGV